MPPKTTWSVPEIAAQPSAHLRQAIQILCAEDQHVAHRATEILSKLQRAAASGPAPPAPAETDQADATREAPPVGKRKEPAWDDVEICVRCEATFYVADWSSEQGEECYFHVGKSRLRLPDFAT